MGSFRYSGGINEQLQVSLEDLDQSRAEVKELQENLKDAEDFIETLKG